MKKLMMMIGAVATALGLFADPVAYEEAGVSFEADEPGVSGSVFTPSNAVGWTWAPATDMTLLAYAGDAYAYPLIGEKARRDGSDGTNSCFQTKSNDNYLKLDTGLSAMLTREVGNTSNVVDQLVKFTGFEAAPVVTNGQNKIAVWMSEFITDETTEATETNLYITVGKFADGVITPTNLLITKSGAACKLDTWYRLTIKSIGNVFDSGSSAKTIEGFEVYLDGDQVTSNDAKTLIEEDSKMTANAKALMTAGKLFTALVDTNAKLTSVSYQGTGALDDLVIDENGPLFAQTPAEVSARVTIPEGTVLVISNATEEITHENGVFQAAPNSTVYFYFTADENYQMKPVVKTETVTEGAEYVYSDIKPDAVIINVAWNDSENSLNFTNVTGALVKVQELEEQQVGKIEVSALATIPAEQIQGFGKIGLNEYGMITITNAQWAFSGAAATLNATIVAGATVTAQSDAALTFAGTVAGTLQAHTLSVDTAKITLSGEGIVKTTSSLTDANFNAVSGYHVKSGKQTIEDVEYNTYVLDADAPTTFTVTVAAPNKHSTVTVTTNSIPITGVENVYTANVSDTMVVTYTADTGYKFASGAQTTANYTENGSFAAAPVVETIAYAISYKLNGGEVATANPESYTIESGAITLYNPTKTGYTFAGWTGTDLSEATKTVTIAAGSTGDRNYEATYTINTFTVTFSTNNVTTAYVKTMNDVVYNYTIKSDDVPSITEAGAWDVNPAGAVITCDTNFNYTVVVGPAPVDPDDPGASAAVAAEVAKIANDTAMQAIIGTDVATYNKYALWAQKLSDPSAVYTSSTVAESFAFAQDHLLTSPVVTMESFGAVEATDAANNQAYGFTFTVKDGSDPVTITTIVNDAVAKLVKCSDDVGFGSGHEITATVTTTGPVANVVGVKVELPKNKTQAFMKIGK